MILIQYPLLQCLSKRSNLKLLKFLECVQSDESNLIYSIQRNWRWVKLDLNLHYDYSKLSNWLAPFGYPKPLRTVFSLYSLLSKTSFKTPNEQVLNYPISINHEMHNNFSGNYYKKHSARQKEPKNKIKASCSIWSEHGSCAPGMYLIEFVQPF